jgi:hypothetical protein
MNTRQLPRRTPRVLAAVALLGALSFTAACGDSVTVKTTGLSSPSPSTSSSTSVSASAAPSSSDSSSSSPAEESSSSGLTLKDASCTDALSALESFDSKVLGDTDYSQVKTDTQAIVTRLRKDAQQESDPAAKADMEKIASDFSTMIAQIDKGQTPDTSGFEADGESLGEDCV